MKEKLTAYFNSSTTSLKRASMINLASKYSVVAINLLFGAVLARMLTPQEYGIVAIVTVFTSFFFLFGDMGLGVGVIQNKTLTIQDENRIFSFSLYLGVALAVLFLPVSFVLNGIYDTQVYTSIVPLLSVALAFQTFNTILNAKILKEKLFMQAAMRNIVSCMIGYVVAVVIAAMGGKYYALVLQAVVQAIVVFFLNLRYAGLRYDGKHMVASVKIILHYSSYQFASNVVIYFSQSLDKFLAGYFFGEAQLGYYDKAYKLIRYPVSNLAHAVSPAIQPILSDHQDDKEYVFARYEKMTRLLTLIGVFIACVSWFASKEIILLYFGSQWDGAIVSFRYFSLSLVFQIIVAISGGFFQSLNQTKVMFWSGILGMVLVVIGVMAGVAFGSIDMLALCFSLAIIANFFKTQWLLARFCFTIELRRLFKPLVRPALIAAVMSAVLFCIPTFDSLWLSLVIKLAAAGAAYTIMLYLTKEYKVLYDALPGRWKRKKANTVQADASDAASGKEQSASKAVQEDKGDDKQ